MISVKDARSRVIGVANSIMTKKFHDVYGLTYDVKCNSVKSKKGTIFEGTRTKTFVCTFYVKGVTRGLRKRREFARKSFMVNMESGKVHVGTDILSINGDA